MVAPRAAALVPAPGCARRAGPRGARLVDEAGPLVEHVPVPKPSSSAAAAAIVAVPRTGHDLSAIRDEAHRIESTMHQHTPEAGPGPEACGLFTIARLPNVNVATIEGKNAVRILMTTSNPAEVKDLRRIAREQVSTMARTPARRR